MAIALGIDIGTSGTKALAIDLQGRILASASQEYPCDYPKPGWSEQDPAHWWQASALTIQAVLNHPDVSADQVVGVGLSGQMHGSVFLDESGEVIRPALLWNDQRTARECEEIEQRAGGREELVKLVANPALTGFTAPKLLWLRNHEPHNWERVRQILLPKDYVRYRLSGTYATEVSDASGTLLLDVANRRWSRALLEKLEIESALLPDCFESPVVSAQVSEQAAQQTGLQAGTPIVGGGGDQPAGAVGNGIVKSGIVSVSLGTSGVVFAHSDQLGFDPLGRLQRGCHAVPGAYHLMGVVLSAAGSLQWTRDQIGSRSTSTEAEDGSDAYERMLEEAAEAPAGSEGLIFLPYLTGERTPHFDPEARGGWVGLTVRHKRSHLIRSVLEGVTFAMRDSFELIRQSGARIDEVRIFGGGAKSPLWKQIHADALGYPMTMVNSTEGPAFGVALLALVGAGRYSNLAEACDATIRLVDQIPAHPAAKPTYDSAYQIYGQLYQDLRSTFPRMASVGS